MRGTSSAGFPQYIEFSVEGHDPIVVIVVTVGSSLAKSMASHLSCIEGAFFCG